MDDSFLYVVSVEGDVPDDEHAALRGHALFSAGHVGTGRTGDIRAGSCITQFNALGAEEAEVREQVTRLLADYRVVGIELVG
jgi:hypothetical protein